MRRSLRIHSVDLGSACADALTRGGNGVGSDVGQDHGGAPSANPAPAGQHPATMIAMPAPTT